MKMIVVMFFMFWQPVVFALEQLKDTKIRAVQDIEVLNVEMLPIGQHMFYLKAGWLKTGQQIRIPVMVMKGSMSGKKLMLTASVHGDELNGIRVIHKVFDQVDQNTLTGTLIAVPGVNQSGLETGSRYFSSTTKTGRDDLNRLFPGGRESRGAASLFTERLWNSLLKNNTDLAVDLHTQTQGAAYPVFVFADFSNEVAQKMAYALMPDIIKNDPGQKGALETAFIRENIPAVTFELGQPDRVQDKIVDRAVAGILNLMAQQKMIDGTSHLLSSEISAAPHDSTVLKPYIGSDYTDVVSVEGGFAVMQVALLDDVKTGDHVASIVDPFGRTVRRYFAPHSGRVLAVSTAPLREPGAMLVRIIK